VLIPAKVADGIAAGEITVQFRWWKRPTVKAGGSLRSRVGVLQIDAVDVIGMRQITVKDARAAGYPTRATPTRSGGCTGSASTSAGRILASSSGSTIG
jgi:hypothetical protein